LINLNANNKISRLTKNWILKFSLLNNDKLKLVRDNDKLYLHIIWFNIQEEWKIRISYKGKYKDISYKINYIKNHYSFDIKNDLLKRRLQQKPLSCESSAASDVIYFFTGKYVDEYEVYNKLDKDMAYTKAINQWGRKIWWNPNNGFVWHVDYYWKNNIKPVQWLYTWYWVYEKPIAKVYNKYWLKTNIINIEDHNEFFWEKEHLTFILNSLKKWKMIQLWWDRCTDPNEEDWTIDWKYFNTTKFNQWYSWKNKCYSFSRDRKLEWYYKEDWILKKHIWLSWEHAFYLLWYEWDIEAPVKIIVWDTDTWYHKYSTNEWLRKWERMDYRTIVVSNEESDSKKLTKHFSN
jgi:hypothetical protein